MRRLRSAKCVIGLDIGRASIKAVQVSLREKSLQVEGCVCLARSAAGYSLVDEEAAHFLRVMERQGLTGSRVVLVAPTEALVGGSIDLPPAGSGVSRDKIVEMELSRTHKLAPGSFEMAWWDLPAPASGARLGQAHALGLPHHAVEATLQTLSTAGLEIVRTVPGSLALLASAQRHPIDPRRISAVLDLGLTRGHLGLMYAGRVVHERALPDFNMQRLMGLACAQLGADPIVARYALGSDRFCGGPDGAVASATVSLLSEAAEALAEEVGMSFAYVSHLYPEADLGQLLLAGGGANLAGFAESLADMLELPTVVITPKTLLAGGYEGDGHDDPSLVAALGASLCGEAG